MTVAPYLTLIILLIGGLLFLLARNSNDVRELGRIMFAMGLLALLLQNGAALWK